MLVGHFAVAFLGKRVEPKLSLGTLMLASMLPDLLWPLFSIAGIEYGDEVTEQHLFSAPYSHSLLTVTIFAALFAASYALWQHYRRHLHAGGSFAILFTVILSHWILDAISHQHTLAPGAQRHFGFALWNHFVATLLVEGGFWLLAIILYVRATRPTKRAGIYAFWPVVVLLTFIWVTNIRSGPPPPRAVISSLIFFLLVIAWSYWINRVRAVRA